MGFSRQEYWSGLPLPPSGDIPDPGTEPGSLALQVDSLPIELCKHLFLPQLTSLQILTYHGSTLWSLTYFWGLYHDSVHVCVLNVLPSAHWSLRWVWFQPADSQGQRLTRAIKRTKEGEETHPSSLRPLGSELLCVGNGSEPWLEWWLPGAGESGEWRISVWGHEKALERDGGDGCTTMWMYVLPLIHTLKNG